MAVRPPPAALKQLLAGADRRVAALARAARALVLAEAPEAEELVYDSYNAVAVAFTYSGRLKEAFCHVAVYARHVNLGFNQGAALRDPGGYLRGSGRQIRHVRLTRLEELRAPAVRALVRAAVARAERPRARPRGTGRAATAAARPSKDGERRPRRGTS